MATEYVSPDWGNDVETAKVRAISFYHLDTLGWKGFNELDWAAALLKKYPSIPVILLACHIGQPASFEALRELADEMIDEDRHRLRDYIMGELGLEELQDKTNSHTALHRCAELSFTWK